MKQEIIEKLRTILPERVSTDLDDIAKHSVSMFYISHFSPDVICYPLGDDDILKIVDICIEFKIPLIPYGSGTSVEGHTAAVYGGICLDMRYMNKVLEINTDDNYVQVQPGISYNELNEKLAKYGYHFPVEAGFGASIGGMVATNASGAGATDVGSMSKNVKSCDVVVYKDNKAIKITTGTKAPKSSAGFNLTSLFVGSEGTLGVITKVTLQIRKNFEVNHTLCCQFENISQAVDFVALMKGTIQFRRIELLDKLQTKACVEFSKLSFLDINLHTIIIELAGNKKAVDEQIEIVNNNLHEYSAVNIAIYRDVESAADIWMMRKNACPAAIKLIDSDKKAMATDVCVPISKLSACIQACYQHMQELRIQAPLVAHVGDGNFHFTVLVNPDNPEEIRIAKEFNRRIVIEALKFGGTCTGEHGIGIGKIDFLEMQHHDTIFLMEAIKKSFDPLYIFNPGKIVTPKKKYFCDNKARFTFNAQHDPEKRPFLYSKL